MGQLVGAALAMALFGALFAWILRKIVSLSLVPSYAIGILAAVLIGSYLYTLGQSGSTFLDALVIYAIGGIIALPLLVLTARNLKTAQSEK